MPLRATGDAGDIHAFALQTDQWAALKGNYKALNLRMPCCQVAAVPKTSTLGNFFFAHARRGECKTAPESAEHIYCKTLIAQAAAAVGWTVTTERVGVSPNGDDWVADVFCEKGSAKLALEVQMSPQLHEETVRRQERYKASGVRGAWFYGAKARKGPVAFDKNTPAFALTPVVIGQVPTVQRFDVSLTEFVTGMLQKRLGWTIPEYSRPHYIEFLVDTCWACKKPVKQIFEHTKGQDVPEGEVLTIENVHEGRWHEPAYTVASLSSALEEVLKVVSNDELVGQGLNLIGKMNLIHGKPTKWPYCNFCIHCRAPQNNFHLGEKLRDGEYARRPVADDTETREAYEGDDRKYAPEQSRGLVAIPRVLKGSGYWELFDGPGTGA
jgi:hypothetical protein